MRAATTTPAGAPTAVRSALPKTAAFPVIMAGRLPRRLFGACKVFTLHCSPHGTLTSRGRLFREYSGPVVASCSRPRRFRLERCRRLGISPGDFLCLFIAYTTTSSRTRSAQVPLERKTGSSSGTRKQASDRRSSTRWSRTADCTGSTRWPTSPT
jgi:hypothetical protein